MSPESRQTMIVVSSPPASPRLLLRPTRARHAMIDAGWWPRSWDPVAELPGLVAALSDRYGPIRQVMLSSGTWQGDFRRLAIGTAVIRVGWFASLDAAVLIATTCTGDQLDILVIPPGTAPDAADRAMTAAVDSADARRGPDRLAAFTSPAAGPTTDTSAGKAVWDNEGGRISTSRPQRPQEVVTTTTTASG
jgi:hypothetical protein